LHFISCSFSRHFGSPDTAFNLTAEWHVDIQPSNNSPTAAAATAEDSQVGPQAIIYKR
jgi:hypothetical protein